MAHTTYRHEVDVHRRHGEGAMVTGHGRPPMVCARSACWSAEELLLGAIGLGLMTTFQSLAEREHLAVFAYDSRVSGAVGAPRESRFVRVHVHVCVAGNGVPRATMLLEEAQRDCAIVNALGIPVTLEITAKAHHEHAHPSAGG